MQYCNFIILSKLFQFDILIALTNVYTKQLLLDSIKALAKWLSSVDVLTEICHQRSKYNNFCLSMYVWSCNEVAWLNNLRNVPTFKPVNICVVDVCLLLPALAGVLLLLMPGGTRQEKSTHLNCQVQNLKINSTNNARRSFKTCARSYYAW